MAFAGPPARLEDFSRRSRADVVRPCDRVAVVDGEPSLGAPIAVSFVLSFTLGLSLFERPFASLRTAPGAAVGRALGCEVPLEEGAVFPFFVCFATTTPSRINEQLRFLPNRLEKDMLV